MAVFQHVLHCRGQEFDHNPTRPSPNSRGFGFKRQLPRWRGLVRPRRRLLLLYSLLRGAALIGETRPDRGYAAIDRTRAFGTRVGRRVGRARRPGRCEIRVGRGPEHPAAREDRERARTRRGEKRAQRPAGAVLQGLQVDDDKQELEPAPAGRGQGRVDEWRSQPALHCHIAQAARMLGSISLREHLLRPRRWRASQIATYLQRPAVRTQPRTTPARPHRWRRHQSRRSIILNPAI